MTNKHITYIFINLYFIHSIFSRKLRHFLMRLLFCINFRGLEKDSHIKHH